MKRFVFITTAVLALGLAAEHGQAQIVVVKRPTHKKVVVIKPASPAKNTVWVSGHWKAGAHKKYVWIDGHWLRKRPGAIWVDGHWKRVRGGWVWIDGHWRS